MHNHVLVVVYHTTSITLGTCNSKCNLEGEYRDCIKSRRDKIGITRHIMMHQVLYNVHVTLFIGQLQHLVHHDMPCDPNLVLFWFCLFCFLYNPYIPLLNCINFTCLLSLKGLTEKLYAYALDRKKTSSHAKFQV